MRLYEIDMWKKMIAVVLFAFTLTGASAQSVKEVATSYHPRELSATIGEKYILLPVDSNKHDFGSYLHLWANPTVETSVQAAEGGKTIVTLQSIMPGSYARLVDRQDAVYVQYFRAGAEEMLYFMPLADYMQAKALVNKPLWLKSNRIEVVLTDVQLTADHNQPLLLTYKYKDGKKASVTTVLSGTNSTLIQKSTRFDQLFYVSKP